MAGRASKPVELLKNEKKSHRTKAELEFRKSQEEKLKSGKNNFNESPQVKNNSIAHTEFLRLKRLYNKLDYVEALDEQIINRYCLLIAKQTSLEKLMSGMENDLMNCETFQDRLALYGSIKGIQGDINKVQDMLLKIEDRMFLNASSRIKNIPKTPPKEIDDLGDKFGV